MVIAVIILKVPHHSEADDILRAFILQFYLNDQVRQNFPKEIILSHAVADADTLLEYLNNKLSNQILLKTKVRGDRANFLRIALTNAQHSLENKLAQKTTIQQRMTMLQEALDLPKSIERMECFDISHTQGEATVASCVVFDENGPATNQYRRFNIRDITGGDDSAAMRQAFQRRFKTKRVSSGYFIY